MGGKPLVASSAYHRIRLRTVQDGTQLLEHLRTTNPVESPFAAVRLRTDAGKRYKKVPGATALTWRLLLVAERRFRRLDHPELLPEVALRVCYRDGIRVVDEVPETTDQEVAA